MTDKQRLFCVEYLEDFNGAAAVRRAGYDVKTDGEAASIACKLKKDPEIITEIEKLAQEILDRRKAEIDAKIVNELEKIGWAEGVEKTTDRLRAIEMLGKYRKMFIDRVEHSGTVGVTINVNFTEGENAGN